MYDAGNRKIDPADPKAPPYSPAHTCGQCHDCKAIAEGHHFNAFNKPVGVGRPGEPWIWVDTRTGTWIPLSYRGWQGTYDPEELGISARDFVLKFGRHFPGGNEETAEGEEARWKLSGALDVDCMICHGGDTFRPAPADHDNRPLSTCARCHQGED